MYKKCLNIVLLLIVGFVPAAFADGFEDDLDAWDELSGSNHSSYWQGDVQSLNQNLDGNIAIVRQFGSMNQIDATQIGNNNKALAYQSGENNAVNLSQTGMNHRAIAIQYGYNNSMTLIQEGAGNSIRAIQVGSGMRANITQR
ncbi:hypothetical protein ACQZV8_05735 [Magnetococcales bacterium HHB-1]